MLQPSEQQCAAELAKNATTPAAAAAAAVASAPAATHLLEQQLQQAHQQQEQQQLQGAQASAPSELDEEAKWAEEMDLVERNKRLAAEGGAPSEPLADQGPSIKRAKGDATGPEVTAHDILLQVAKAQLAAAREKEVKAAADNDAPTLPLGAASGSSSSSSAAGAPLADLAEALANCG